MKERPILFSPAPMVRAILDGRKTQTRRVVKPKHEPDAVWGRDEDTGIVRTFRFGEHAPTGAVPWWNLGGINGASQHCPYGVPGDRLWVRETWAQNWHQHSDTRMDRSYVYRADGEARAQDNGTDLPWRPSIHMPRWASRITLEIESVRVERLQDISEADALAEGVERIFPAGHPADTGPNHYTAEGPERVSLNQPTAVGAFRALWALINGDDSWSANPWVWVLSFRRVTP